VAVAVPAAGSVVLGDVGDPFGFERVDRLALLRELGTEHVFDTSRKLPEKQRRISYILQKNHVNPSGARHTVCMAPTIRPPRPDELETLRDIERDAGQLFAEIGLDEIAAHDPESIETLTQYLAVERILGRRRRRHRRTPRLRDRRHRGRVRPHRADQRAARTRGAAAFGTILLEYVCAWAKNNGFGAVTLTTFRDVAWNAPFYAKHGFRVLDAADTGRELTERRAEEATYGLDPALRVCMRRDLPKP